MVNLVNLIAHFRLTAYNENKAVPYSGKAVPKHKKVVNPSQGIFPPTRRVAKVEFGGATRTWSRRRISLDRNIPYLMYLV